MIKSISREFYVSRPLILLACFAICVWVPSSGCGLFSSEVHAQNNLVEVITCESIVNPDQDGGPHTSLRPTETFRSTTDNNVRENVQILLRFVPFNQDTNLAVIVTRSPNEQYVGSRMLHISAIDRSVATGVSITQQGQYQIHVVNSANDVLGSHSFVVIDRGRLFQLLMRISPFALVAVLLIALSIVEHRRLRGPTFVRWFYKRPVLLATTITIIVLSLAVFVEDRGHNFLQHSNLIGILGVIGIIGTIIGVVLTYGQLKLAEDRIENYEKFYDVLDELLKDNKARLKVSRI